MACQISSHGVSRSTWCIWYRSTWSVWSRRRLASQARRMFTAESFEWFGHSEVWPNTFVASTTLSRRPSPLANHLPRICSVSPFDGSPPYRLAVSKKLIPCSRARSNTAWASSSDAWVGKFIVPRQRGLTRTPSLPRCRYSMWAPFSVGERGDPLHYGCVMRRAIRLVRDPVEPPALDTAVSHALLRRASDRLEPETLRLYRPNDVVAFGPLDRLATGFRSAVAAAEERGFASVQRLAGGRAAVFADFTVAFAWIVPLEAPRLGIQERFQELAEIMADAFRSLGVDARIGRVAGEYCPGAHSVNARGRTKLMGVGQRLVSRAVHVGGVVVVTGGDLVRDILVPVYQALGLDWDPATAGALVDEVERLTWEDAEDAVVRQFAARYPLEDGAVGEDVIRLAEELRPRHLAP